MEDRVLSGAVLAVLSTMFGIYGLWQLFAAYRTGSLNAWVERAIQGGTGVVVSGFFAVLVVRLFS
jgi:hypothetical protein